MRTTQWMKLFRQALLLLIAAACAPAHVRAQTDAEKAQWAYDVVSIKLEHPDVGSVGIRKTSTGFEAYTVTLRDLIKEAYGLQDPSLVAMTPESKTQYHVIAKLDEDKVAILNGLSPQEQLEKKRLMLQSLLAEYFHLKVHPGKQALNVYSLVVDKSGAKLIEVAPDRDGVPAEVGNSYFADGRVTGIFSMSQLVRILSISRVAGIDTSDRPMIDNTGLNGKYRVDLTWIPLSGEQNAKDTNAEVYTSLQSALQNKLGLKLIPQKIQADAIIVDHAEKPALD